jgi:photosystem II stability/assembly factor-like uncharacterized protein
MWLLIGCAVSGLAPGQSWQPQVSGVTAGLRGVSAVNARVAYAGGSQGTILKTTDGGTTWQNVSPVGSADADFRDLEALNEREVFALSSGAGRLSRLYKTSDGGLNWTLARVNPDPDGFWDAISFWDAGHGILMGDPVNGRFTILTSTDGGANWKQQEGPKAEKGEAAFAASGTALFRRGTREAWFATGGSGGGRVFHTEDGGATWAAVRTPLRPSSDGAGIFSLAFAGPRLGVAVGGDYTKPADASGNIAITQDGGRTWVVPTSSPGGYRSAIANVSGMWLAVGTSGSDVSQDDGRTWRPFDTASYNAMSFATDGAGWAVGPGGAIAKFSE